MESSQNNEKSSLPFPGFQKFDPQQEYVPLRRALSRLQTRAPCPLQLKPSVSFKSKGTPKVLGSSSSSSSFSTVDVNNQNKDPIPLLSPLVSPSVEKSNLFFNEINTAKSH